MIDSHSHLFDKAFDEDREQAIQRAKENGVNKIVLVGFSHETNEKSFQMSLKDPIFYPTAGIHPSEASEKYKEDIVKLDNFISSHKVYALGECGLDYYWVKDNKEIQKELFIEQIKLAIKYRLPLIVHMRDASLDTFNILKEYKGQIKGVMHCYSGSYEMALEFIKIGFYISLGGPVTFKNAQVPKEVAKKIPLERLLIETDCPYLAPTPYRGKRNESAYVKNVLEEIANIRGLDIKTLEIILERNTNELFNLNRDEEMK